MSTKQTDLPRPSRYPVLRNPSIDHYRPPSLALGVFSQALGRSGSACISDVGYHPQGNKTIMTSRKKTQENIKSEVCLLISNKIQSFFNLIFPMRRKGDSFLGVRMI